MPQMKPNSAIVEATVTHVEAYSMQTDFSVLWLNVKSAKPKADMAFMFDKEKDRCIKALVNTQEYINAHIKSNSITAELKKVSTDMWRITSFISK